MDKAKRELVKVFTGHAPQDSPGWMAVNYKRLWVRPDKTVKWNGKLYPLREFMGGYLYILVPKSLPTEVVCTPL